MYKVLIVDDDPAICEGLPLLIDWAARGYRIEGTAANGQIALEMLRKGRYDLLITDVRMPRLDGISLIRQLQSEQITINTIILSGYKDFEYAQSALEYGVKKYILKPINEAVLIKTIGEIKADLDERAVLREALAERQQMLRERCLNEALRSGDLSASCLEILGRLGLGLDHLRYRVILLAAGQEHRPALLQALQQIAAENGLGAAKIMASSPDPRHIAILFASASLPAGQVMAAAAKIREQAGRAAGFTPPAAVGSEAGSLREIAQSYADAANLLAMDLFTPEHGIASYEEVHINRTIDKVVQYITENCQEKISLQSIAAEFYMNPAYLGRLFRRQTHLSFKDYLAKCRIDLAKKLLLNKNLSIAEVGERVGYADYNYFCQLFKATTGKTPTEYHLNQG